MESQNPKKRARVEDSPIENKHPAAHIASYKLVRNLKTKIVKANLHITNLKKALEDKKPPYRLLPKIHPYIPTTNPNLIVKWEATSRDFALHLCEILLSYWQERLPILEEETTNLIQSIKTVATKADFDLIVKISDNVAEKHRLAPLKPLRRPVHASQCSTATTSHNTTWKEKRTQVETNQTEDSQPGKTSKNPEDNTSAN
jgi:hypothetical protein